MQQEVDEALAGEVAALEVLDRIAFDPDALFAGVQLLNSATARRAFLRSIQKLIEHHVPAAGKATAVHLYCAGIVSHAATEAAFSRHPEWRDA